MHLSTVHMVTWETERCAQRTNAEEATLAYPPSRDMSLAGEVDPLDQPDQSSVAVSRCTS